MHRRRVAEVTKKPPPKSRTRVWRTGDPPSPIPEVPSSTPASADPPPKRATLREVNTELSELAARKQLHPDDVQRLKRLLTQIERIINDTAPFVDSRPGSRREYERALKSQRRALALAAGPNRGTHPAGRAQNRGLTQGGREILGGLPSSRRRH